MERGEINHGATPNTQETIFAVLDSFSMFIEMNKEDYPELNTHKEKIILLVRVELSSLMRIIKNSEKMLEKELVKLEDQSNPESALFKVFDTLGIPVDYAISLLKNKGLEVDMGKFDLLLEKHRIDSMTKNKK